MWWWWCVNCQYIFLKEEKETSKREQGPPYFLDNIYIENEHFLVLGDWANSSTFAWFLSLTSAASWIAWCYYQGSVMLDIKHSTTLQVKQISLVPLMEIKQNQLKCPNITEHFHMIWKLLCEFSINDNNHRIFSILYFCRLFSTTAVSNCLLFCQRWSRSYLNYCCMCSIKAKKYSTIYGRGETEVLAIKLQFVVAHLCAKVTQNK